jgi:AcrR family transcriptional regulator
VARQSKSKQKRVRNPAATRAKLLQATIELVTEKGAEALSLKEAARRANVSRGVAYLHFDDREQLLNEARNWISERLQDGLRDVPGNASLYDRTFHGTKLVLDHPEASKLMMTSALSGADLDRKHPLYKLTLSSLEKLRDAGKVRSDVDIEILTYILFGSIASTIMLGAQCKSETTQRLAERYTYEWSRILQEGIFVPRSRRSRGGRRSTGKAARRR